MATPLPLPLRNVVELLVRLPGFGEKSAMRVAMSLLKWPESETRRLGAAIQSLRDSLTLCSRCRGVAASDPCPLCSDPQRNEETLCIVPEWDSLLALESGGFYDGQYFVLGGLLSPQRKVDSSSLELEQLEKRLQEGKIKEIILALGGTLEAENTASYIKSLVGKSCPHLQISRLAQGIPLGGEVNHMDRETLRLSLKHRQKM